MIRICVIDTDILIQIINKKDIQQKLVSQIKLRGFEIIIPKKVREEFTNKRKDNQKKLDKFIDKWQIQICTIKNNPKELSMYPIDDGEADAFLQTQKIKEKYYNSHKIFTEFLFVSNDKNALKYFEMNFIKIMKLSDIIPG